jgi:hypothetical protein
LLISVPAKPPLETHLNLTVSSWICEFNLNLDIIILQNGLLAYYFECRCPAQPIQNDVTTKIMINRVLLIIELCTRLYLLWLQPWFISICREISGRIRASMPTPVYQHKTSHGSVMRSLVLKPRVFAPSFHSIFRITTRLRCSLSIVRNDFHKKTR